MSCRCGMQHSVGKIILVTLAIVTITFSQKESDNKDSNDCIKDIISDPNKVTGCGQLTSPKNGRLDLMIGLETDSEKEPEKAFFSCDPGYHLIGPTTITCRDSSWEGKEPVCQPVDCGPPKAPQNGRVDYQITTYQSKAYYHCDACATLVGVQRISCKKSGLWSKTLPKCVFDKECPPITLPKNSKVSRLDTTDNKPRVTKCGERVEIDCFGGYKLIEAGIATCQPDGTYTWLGGTPAYCRRLNWT